MSQKQDEKNQEELLIRAARGDVSAFEQLIAGYEKMIYSHAYRMMGNAWDARDAAQEALIKIYRNIHRCHEMRTFAGWVRKITHNTCIDELRKRGNRRETSLNKIYETEEGNTEIQFESREPGPLDSLLSKEKQERIQRAINKLSPKYKSLIVLRDINGLSYEELTGITGLALGTVKSRLSRAREKLKKLLSNEYNPLK